MNLETIQQEIRAEAERLRRDFRAEAENDGRENTAYAGDENAALLAPLRLGELSFAPTPRAHKGAYRYRDLAAFDDREFIRTAYRALLRHGPDAQGERGYLDRLRGGAHKAEILLRLRFSHEGRTQGVRVRGMIPPLIAAALARVPLFGPLTRWITALVGLSGSLGELRRRQEIMRAHLNENLRRVERKSNEQSARINALLDESRRPHS